MSAFAKVLILLQFIILLLPNIASGSVPKVDATNSSNLTQGCLPTISQSAMKSILELMSDEITHVIDLKVWIESANNSLNKAQELTGIKWANEIGRTLITLAADAENSDRLMLLSYTITMKAGHHDVNIVITEETMQCLFSRDNTSDHAIFDLLVHELHQTSGSKTDYKLCLPFDDSNQGTKYNCCTIVGPNDTLICSDYSSVVIEMLPILVLITLVFFVYMAFPITQEYLHQFKESDKYRISNSPMSISSILYSVFIKGQESGKSTTRKFMLGLFVLVTTLPKRGVFLWIYLGIMSPWYFFLFTDVVRYDENRLLELTENTSLHKPGIKRPYSVKDIRDQCPCKKSESKNSGTEETPLVATQQKTLCTLCTLCFITRCIFSFLNSMRHLIISLVLLALYFIGLAFSFLCTLAIRLKNIICFPNTVPVTKFSWLTKVCLTWPIRLINILIFFYSIYNALSLVFYLIIGLFLNAEIFSPYVLPLCTIVFYSWTKWRSAVETKYLVLITNIYKVCKESLEDSDECSNKFSGTVNDTDRSSSTNLFTIKSDEKGEPVISKELYDMVREQILPVPSFIIIKEYFSLRFLATFYTS